MCCIRSQAARRWRLQVGVAGWAVAAGAAWLLGVGPDGLTIECRGVGSGRRLLRLRLQHAPQLLSLDKAALQESAGKVCGRLAAAAAAAAA